MKADLDTIDAARRAAAEVYCTIIKDRPKAAAARGLAIRSLEALAVASGSEPFTPEFDAYHRSWFNGKGWPDHATSPFRLAEADTRTRLLTELAELLGVETTVECDAHGDLGLANWMMDEHCPRCSGTGRVPRTLAEIVEASRKESKNG